MSFVKDSTQPYKTTKIDYEHEELHFYKVGDEVRIYGHHDHDDED